MTSRSVTHSGTGDSKGLTSQQLVPLPAVSCYHNVPLPPGKRVCPSERGFLLLKGICPLKKAAFAAESTLESYEILMVCFRF